jgi:hypothetical protein
LNSSVVIHLVKNLGFPTTQYKRCYIVALYLNKFCITWISCASIRLNKIRGYSNSTVIQLMYVKITVLYNLKYFCTSQSYLSLYFAFLKIGSAYLFSSIFVIIPYMEVAKSFTNVNLALECKRKMWCCQPESINWCSYILNVMMHSIKCVVYVL